MNLLCFDVCHKLVMLFDWNASAISSSQSFVGFSLRCQLSNVEVGVHIQFVISATRYIIII